MTDLKNINFGDKRILGQARAKEQVERILSSGRIAHAYLISGPPGVGKTAFALAFAEAVNGIENMTQLGERTQSKKSSWFTHPDIHVFIPKPTKVKTEDLRERLELLEKDPYQIISFAQRPSLDEDVSKNLQAFYPVDYFKEDIRPIARYNPNEGNRTVVIMTQIETMRKETANAFLKLLEEPSGRVMFILTTESYDSLLPTITSRCQHIPLSKLSIKEVEQGLKNYDGFSSEEASYLARISNGNYAMTRFFDAERLRQDRDDIVRFFRLTYIQDAIELSNLSSDWQSAHNIEGLLSLLDLMENYIRDLIVFKHTESNRHLSNADQSESIQKFIKSLPDARLEEMMQEINRCRPMLKQNVNPKLLFVVLSFRLSALMRGEDPIISESKNWHHLPALEL